MLLSTTQRVCSQHVGAIGVHRYVKKIWQKPWFSKADHSVITPNVMAEVNSSGRTIWSALKHIPYTWECFGLGFSKELSVGWTPLSNLPAVIPSDSLGAELGQKLDPLKKATVRSCPEASICWRRSPPGPFYRWLYREMPQENWNSGTLVGRQMLLLGIFCSWRWCYEKSFSLPSALCHPICELISPHNLPS